MLCCAVNAASCKYAWYTKKRHALCKQSPQNTTLTNKNQNRTKHIMVVTCYAVCEGKDNPHKSLIKFAKWMWCGAMHVALCKYAWRTHSYMVCPNNHHKVQDWPKLTKTALSMLRWPICHNVCELSRTTPLCKSNKITAQLSAACWQSWKRHRGNHWFSIWNINLFINRAFERREPASPWGAHGSAIDMLRTNLQANSPGLWPRAVWDPGWPRS